MAPVLVSLLAGLNSGTDFSTLMFMRLLAKIILLIAGAIFVGYYGFRKMSNFISQHLEKDFMPLFSIGLALIYSGFALYLGLSEILGAFLAGVMLSESGKSRELEHVIFPVRDLTLPFFFFWFGTSIDLGKGKPFWGLLMVLIVLTVAGKIVTGYYGGRIYGLSKRVSARAGFSLVQRGEFSIIIASLGGIQMKVFGGVYVLLTALIGSFLFAKAPQIAKALDLEKKNRAESI